MPRGQAARFAAFQLKQSRARVKPASVSNANLWVFVSRTTQNLMDNMKNICKFIMPFVLVIALASCFPLAPKPTETPSPIPSTQTPFLPILVDRHDPEAVLRAYFDAWGQSNWLALASFMDEKYGRIVGNPVDSVRILEIQLISSSPTDYVYSVLFDIKI